MLAALGSHACPCAGTRLNRTSLVAERYLSLTLLFENTVFAVSSSRAIAGPTIYGRRPPLTGIAGFTPCERPSARRETYNHLVRMIFLSSVKFPTHTHCLLPISAPCIPDVTTFQSHSFKTFATNLPAFTMHLLPPHARLFRLRTVAPNFPYQKTLLLHYIRIKSTNPRLKPPYKG